MGAWSYIEPRFRTMVLWVGACTSAPWCCGWVHVLPHQGAVVGCMYTDDIWVSGVQACAHVFGSDLGPTRPRMHMPRTCTAHIKNAHVSYH